MNVQRQSGVCRARRIESIRSLVLGLVFAVPTAAQPVYDYWRGVIESPGGELPFRLGGVSHPQELLDSGSRCRLGPGPVVFAVGARIALPPYDSWFEVEDGSADAVRWSGTWRKVTAKDELAMPFRIEPWGHEIVVADPAYRSNAPTFALTGEPLDVTGRWRVKFANDPHPAVAIFTARGIDGAQAPGEFDATFMTVTGDYRYLSGTARGSELRLSCFDGAHAFLFGAKLQPDGSLQGDFWSSANWHETWVAHRDDAAALPDAFTLTVAKPDIALGDLAYPDVETGEPVELSSLFGKCTLVVLFGTWCPNCGDSGAYLKGLLARHQARGLRVVGLAFEHGDDAERHARVVRAYREHHDASWRILIAGPSDKQRASAAFPAVDAVRSYPTTLFVDAEGVVRAVHQGFSGPATGAAFRGQCESFETLVDRLLDEAGGERR